MPTPPSLRFSPAAWRSMVSQAEAAYPFEGCGVLLGPYTPAAKIAEKLAPLVNQLRLAGRGRFDFSFLPQEFANVQLAADRENLDVVGIFHTHPDHPARPSATDAAQPMLAGWVNVIASVRGDGRGRGVFKDAKAWWREDEQSVFVEAALTAPEVA